MMLLAPLGDRWGGKLKIGEHDHRIRRKLLQQSRVIPCVASDYSARYVSKEALGAKVLYGSGLGSGDGLVNLHLVTKRCQRAAKSNFLPVIVGSAPEVPGYRNKNGDLHGLER
jgi:hypothetical protein